jgi:tRNA modification GTPase
VSTIRSRTAGISDVLVNDRQARLLEVISDCLASVIGGLYSKASNDELAVDLRQCIRVLGEITGETWNPDVLDTVFSRFCIGK